MTKKSSDVPPEETEQILFATWLRRKNIKFTASANGGTRNLFEAVKLKKMGVSAGFPDIFIPIPNKIFHGLFIEMKRKKGSVTSDAQKDWLSFLREKGYYAEVAKGFDEAVEMVLHYLQN